MKTALLLIDIQNDYFPGGRMELAGSQEAGLQAQKLLGVFREKCFPVFHIQHLAIKPDAAFFLPGTSGADIHTLVRPWPDEPVIQKHYPNSFRNTDLLHCLREASVDRLVMAGMMTHMCVDATVRAAFDLGFACIAIHDACATRQLTFNGVTTPAEAVQAAFLAALASAYARVGSVDDVAGMIA